jgi:hypothetical protein
MSGLPKRLIYSRDYWQKIRELLRESPTPSEDHAIKGWQPISTAPEDCSILGSNGGRIPFVMMWDEVDCIWRTFNGVYETTIAPITGKTWQPTHWLPLPLPPAPTRHDPQIQE